MQKLLNIIFSTRLMAVLFLLLAISMGVATFIEEWFDTATAKYWIYNALWFEAIMAIMCLNFFGNIFRYRLYKKDKWHTLVLHLSFLFILIGAFITRYISYEGVMPIREGQQTNQILSDNIYLQFRVDNSRDSLTKEHFQKKYQKKALLSMILPSLEYSSKFLDKPFSIELTDYVPNAIESMEENPNGSNYIHLVESGGGERHDHYIKEGEVVNLHNILFAYNADVDGAVQFIGKNTDSLMLKTPFGGQTLKMKTQETFEVKADTLQLLKLRSLYQLSGAQFVVPEVIESSEMVFETDEENKNTHSDRMQFLVSSEGQSKKIWIEGGKGAIVPPKEISVGALNFNIQFGPKVYETPFNVKLNDFILERYPGSNSPASFASEVTVIDKENSFDYRIFMNNVLDYSGYRFFQASYDPDEKGTVLSVNHDWWGTNITYFGYIMLYLGLMWTMFLPKTRVGTLNGLIKKARNQRNKLTTVLLLLFGFGSLSAQESPEDFFRKEKLDSILRETVVSKEHAEKFGTLVVQDAGGRMKPINTFSSELLRVVHKGETYLDFNSDQIFLSMIHNPILWEHMPFIYLERKNKKVREVLGVDKDQKYARFTDFFEDDGTYKLAVDAEKAAKSRIKSQYDKDIIAIDKRIYLFYSATNHSLLKFFPIPDREDNKWITPTETNLLKEYENPKDSAFVKNSLLLYMIQIRDAAKSKDYSKADVTIEGISNFQRKYGAEVIPSKEKVKSEILYNKYNIFKKIYLYYILFGIALVFLSISRILKERKFKKWGVITLSTIIGTLFAIHTAGLILRWYVSGHAPWSNGYETMIYIGWVIMFIAIFLSLKNSLVFGAASFLVGIIVSMANLSYFDPEISNLVPVLNSFWILIHVSVIVASYGPFGLGMILGLVSLILILLTNEKNKKRLELTIKELTYTNEIALIIGLSMLTIGNFLGGMWANESWGRYWGWDPKETWALISIMVYAFVLHMRLVPKLRGFFAFNFASVIAIASVMMTYFGVNFYLSGLHSYAKGDSVPIPSWVYVTTGLVFLLGLFSYLKYRKVYN